MPGEDLGSLREDVKNEIGYNLHLVVPCTHDTESAVLAVPSNDDDFVYISSGTWSLLGIERDRPDCSEVSLEHSFTNEGGYDNKIEYLRNIMVISDIHLLKKTGGKSGDFCF